ncbi:MAG: hypothetical protein P9X24_09220 [Candidatus Hatepunaea meridiana]|nr:hypothetical protein [Candidatus Hatepunaea meridiana]
MSLDYINKLREAREAINQQLSSLKADLQGLDEIIRKHSVPLPEEKKPDAPEPEPVEEKKPVAPKPELVKEKKVVVKKPKPKAMKASNPMAVIKRFFDEQPNKNWSPVELRKILEDMNAKGNLKTKTKSMLWTIHGTLRPLADKGYIVKSGKGKQITYKKKV